MAGTTAAETLRRLDENATIALVGDEPYDFYSRIALSKENYMLGKLPEGAIWLKKPSFYAEQRITYFKGRLAAALDTQQKQAMLDNGETVRYGKLLLAVGSTPRRLDIAGSGKRGVHYLRTLEDARGVMTDMAGSTSGLLVGGGFISFELADIMVKRNIKTTVLLREPYYWANLLDEESGRLIEDVLKRNGVEIIYEEEALEIFGGEHVEGVKTNKGRTIPTGFVVAGIGVTDRLKPFQPSGIALGRGVVANERLETSIPDVWAAGDCAEYLDVMFGERVQLGNWANAMLQGRCAAQNMFGKKTEFRALSAYTTTGLGLTICFVGDIRITPEKKVIDRGSRTSGKYSRIVTFENRVVGAMQFNMTPELPWISKLITDRRDITSISAKLADPKEDLRHIATVMVPPKQD